MVIIIEVMRKVTKLKILLFYLVFFVKNYIMLLITVHFLLHLSLSFKLVPGLGSLIFLIFL